MSWSQGDHEPGVWKVGKDKGVDFFLGHPEDFQNLKKKKKSIVLSH